MVVGTGNAHNQPTTDIYGGAAKGDYAAIPVLERIQRRRPESHRHSNPSKLTTDIPRHAPFVQYSWS